MPYYKWRGVDLKATIKVDLNLLEPSRNWMPCSGKGHLVNNQQTSYAVDCKAYWYQTGNGFF